MCLRPEDETPPLPGVLAPEGAQFLLRVFHRRSVAATLREIERHFELPACAHSLACGECKIAELAVNAASNPVSRIGCEATLQISHGVRAPVQTRACRAPVSEPQRGLAEHGGRRIPIATRDSL